MSRIAKPIFNGSPTDDLTAADVYGEVSDTVRNNFTTQFTAFGQSLQENLGQVRSTLDDVGKRLRSGKASIEDAKSRIKSSLRSARGDLEKLSEDITSSIIDGIGGKEIKVALEDGYKTIKSADLDSATGITSMLRDLTGNQIFDVVDVSAQVGMFRGVLEEVASWGVPELVDEVLKEVDDPHTRREVVRYSSSRLSQDSDIDSLQTILGHMDAAALTEGRPDFPKQVLRQYTFPAGTTPEDYPERLTQLVDVMDRLQFDWFWTQRGEEDVWNLSVIQHVSDDARLLFASSPEYQTPVLIAEHYVERPVKTLAHTLYPNIALT